MFSNSARRPSLLVLCSPYFLTLHVATRYFYPDGSISLEVYATCTELKVQKDGQCSVDTVKSLRAAAVARFAMCCVLAVASLVMACIGLGMALQSPNTRCGTKARERSQWLDGSVEMICEEGREVAGR